MSAERCAFVTGASRGIGREIAIELARQGFNIVGNATQYDAADRSRGLAETQLRVEELGMTFVPAPGDIADLGIHDHLLGLACARFGHVDVLVNNAGIGPRERLDFLETSPDSFDHVVAVNLRGTFFLTQCFARHMMEWVTRGVAERPKIVFITSISVDTSSPTRTEYCVTKAAVSHLARVLAHRFAESGIDVYEVRPGLIATDMTALVRDKYDAMIANGLVPQGRWGQPLDVARAVAALARGDFAYSTGGVFEVSGGMNIKRL